MKKFILLFALLAFGYTSNAQITAPPNGDNQKSVVKQYIGSLAYVKLTYNSPDVTAPNGDNRAGKIWGQLVPYGLTDLGFGLRNPSPWRAGANENTTIHFSHDMKIQGKDIKAGTYGFHVVVNETGPWTIILSNNSTAWGSFFYVESDDALRVEATPEESEFHEWLTFEFTDRQKEYAVCALKWENKSLPFKIEVPNMNEHYLATMRNELQNSPGFNWQSWNQAATFCLNNNINLEEALSWADASISAPFVGNENFQTLSTKSQILGKLERTEEAKATMDKAIHHATATQFQIHNFGRQLIGQGQKEKALEIFQYNYERFEGAWPTEVGMARGLSANGQYAKALEHAKKAHEQAPDALNKNGLAQAIEKLKNQQDIN
jgi:hypothetical protein